MAVLVSPRDKPYGSLVNETSVATDVPYGGLTGKTSVSTVDGTSSKTVTAGPQKNRTPPGVFTRGRSALQRFRVAYDSRPTAAAWMTEAMRTASCT